MSVDVVIFGGGIAGLWTLARLKKQGYQAILLENQTLGRGQTGASQGIIHGGTKYALTGKLTHSSKAISGMPERWRKCLSGQGELDLSRVNILSQHQYLWANRNIGSQLAGFFAGKVMNSRMQTLKKADYPNFFSSQAFNGTVYQLNEPVLDSFSLIAELSHQYQDAIFSMQVDSIEKNERGIYRIAGCGSVVNAKVLIFTAGNENQNLLDLVNLQKPKMQQRPLYQPMLKFKREQLPLIYAHCLGTSALPRLTISSYEMDNDVVWYLGGEIAEKGVNLSQQEQVIATKKELRTWLPWLSFEGCQWSAYKVNRAEPRMPNKQRPVDPYVDEQKNIITAWPVKLAMTPIMVDMIVEKIQACDLKPNSKNVFGLDLKFPKIAQAPWQLPQRWL